MVYAIIVFNCFNLNLLPAWISENRVSKHFVISLNFPCLNLFTVLFAYVIFFGCFVVRDFCRSGCRQIFAYFYLTPSPSLPFCTFFPSLPTILCLTQVTVIWNQCAPIKKLVLCGKAVHISLLVTLRKVSWRTSCKALRWVKVNTIRGVCIFQYRAFFFGVKTGSMLVCRPCDCTSGNLNKTSVREKSKGVYLPIGWVYPSLRWTWEDYTWLWIVVSVPLKCVIARRGQTTPQRAY